jgi:hypothetical protein
MEWALVAPGDCAVPLSREQGAEGTAVMVKKAKTKSSTKKAPAKTKPSRPAASTKGASKYDQPGAPWWKKTPLPTLE